MFQVRKILQLKVQFVFLSGTLPLYLEKAIREEFLFNNLSVIRGSTTRANIVYSSKQYSSSREQEQFLEIKEYVEAYYSRFSSLEDKVLIFCPPPDSGRIPYPGMFFRPGGPRQAPAPPPPPPPPSPRAAGRRSP